MNNLILFDDSSRDELLPLTFTRPICDLRIGILTIREKWIKMLGGKVSFITQDYLIEKYPLHYEDENLVINGSVLPSKQLCRLISQLDKNEALLKDGELIAARMNGTQFEHLMKEDEDIEELAGFEVGETPFIKINHLWDIFLYNDEAIQQDFELLTEGRVSQAISGSNQVLGKENIFLEEGAKVECATLNATTGPIYLAKDSEIMEGSVIRGGLALCEGAKIKLGTKIYGPTTIGPYSKVGGEVSNSVIIGYSNKGHDGYLGNSILGEWCNIGAGSSNSNLKNNYAEVRLWNYTSNSFVKTNQQFCGLIMGDHSKCGINTMFNTGTVVGVSSNVFGAGFPRNFIPSFSWGGAKGFSTYTVNKAFEVAEIVMARRNKDFSEKEKSILSNVSDLTNEYRVWDKDSNP